MGKRASLNLSIAAAVLLALFIVALSEQAVAQVQCPSGTVAITDATRPIATAAGLPTSVSCWNPNDPNTGQAAGDAKAWLEQHATASSNISCLNAQFAEKLMTFMQTVPGGIPTITYGYRTIAAENADMKNGSSKLKNACSSYHLYGLAVDFNNASAQTQQWMRLHAPQYGLAPTGVNPTTGCASSGFCDPGHIQMAGPLPPASQCGICNSSGTGVLPGAATAAPAPTLASSIQNPLLAAATPLTTTASVNPFATTPIAATQAAAPSQTQACTPQYFCSASTVYYESSACATSVFQTCQYGCSGTACNQTPGQNSSSSQQPAASTAPLVGTTPIATPSALSPDSSLSQSVSESAAEPAQTATASQSSLQNVVATIATGTPADEAPGIAETTFASPDLSQNANLQPALSPLQQLLANLRSVLVSLLGFLTGSGNAPVQG